MASLLIRLALPQDSQAIFQWRNDPLTRSMSLNSDRVSWDVHQAWYASKLKDESCVLLVACFEEKEGPIAVIRFDCLKEEAAVSINLATTIRGEGLSKLILSKAIHYFSAAHPEILFLNAVVKKMNLASCRLFAGLGFELLIEKSGVNYYQLNILNYSAHFEFGYESLGELVTNETKNG